MKRLITLFFVLIVCDSAIAQDGIKIPIDIEAGFMVIDQGTVNREVNWGGYVTPLGTAYFELIYHTKYDNLNFVTGAMWVINDEQMKGGAVYGGIKTRYSGFLGTLTTEFCLGAFPIRYYYDIADATPSVSTTFGGLATIGVLWKLGKHLSLNPQLIGIVAGGQTSFLFYGIKLPLTITF